MSDQIKHECGIALIRLRKPLAYYIERYGTPTYGINKLYLLMEKQHNRGQDGAGVANIVINQEAGVRYLSRSRSVESTPIADIFDKILSKFAKAQKNQKQYKDADWLQRNVPYTGEVFMGHLRYGTHGSNILNNCHPVMRRSNWRSKVLAVAGNFNMTNVDELFEKLISMGQHPKEKTDTTTVLEKIGHFLDRESDRLTTLYEQESDLSDWEITRKVERDIDLQKVLQKSCKDFDGGYAMIGMTGYGAAFAVRDPSGIRPAYYYADDEVVVVASEKPAIKTAFNVDYSQIKEIERGNALIIKDNGEYAEYPIVDQLPKTSCSFERIYFSRGTDPEIYNERKSLGRLLSEQILEELDNDLEYSVFSFIPNTAESSFLGLIQELEDRLVKHRQKLISENKIHGEELQRLLSLRPRIEKLISKDAKMRTFITDSQHRNELVSHVYDATYEVIKKRQDTVVVIDDSIVRGTTLEKSIINILERLEPKKIVIVSSAPQIRYPDCYGIDMSKIKDFIAFRAMLELLKESKQEYMIREVYKKCQASMSQETHKIQNHVKELYDLFTYDQVSEKVAQIVKPSYVKADVKVIFQTVKNLHKACPNHIGDWYFTGNYPTAGGNKVVNRAYMNFVEGIEGRAY